MFIVECDVIDLSMQKPNKISEPINFGESIE